MEEITVNQTVSLEAIQQRIYEIRGVKVMLDVDLAKLYEIDTRNLKKAVRRNLDRFPLDFMFELTFEEAKCLVNSGVFQIGTPSYNFSAYAPFAFTEEGVAMLSSVLRSSIAVKVNIDIMRAFVKMRHFIVDEARIFKRLDIVEYSQLEIKQQQAEIQLHQLSTDKRIEEVFQLMEHGNKAPQQGVFYDGQIYDAYTFVSDLIRSATSRIILIDNYIDDTVLTMLDKRQTSVKACIYTSHINKSLELDIQKHNEQYQPIDICICKHVHDRFLVIDEKVYHIGASIKDLGKKLFAFSLMHMLNSDELFIKISSLDYLPNSKKNSNEQCTQ